MYEDMLKVAKNKEWKLKRMSWLGVETLPRGIEVKQVRFVENRVPEELHHHVHTVAPIVPLIVSVALVAFVQDEGLKQEMRQVVDLMKNLSLNLMSNVGGNCG